MIAIKFLKACYEDSLNNVFFKGKNTEIIEFTEDKLKEILKNYYPEYIVQDWYDDEPEFDDEEEYAMFLDYQEKYLKKDFKLTGTGIFMALEARDEKEGKIEKFSKQKHTKKELKEAYERVLKIYKNYEKERMKFNTWEDLYVKGNFALTQKDVNKFCKQFVKDTIEKQHQKPLKFRFTKVQVDEKQFCIFNFTRDLLGYDTRIYFTKNGYRWNNKINKFVKIRKK